jgi:hypothetical protein
MSRQQRSRSVLFYHYLKKEININPKSYRRINLLNVHYKIFSKMTYKKSIFNSEKFSVENQTGFRKSLPCAEGREEVMGGWIRLHNEELHNLYASQNIIRVIKSRRMRSAEHVARMGEMRNAYNILDGKPVRKIPLCVDGNAILEWILGR